MLWTLRKYIDRGQYLKEDAARKRDRRVARRQGIGDGGDDDAAAGPASERRFRCRVCGRVGSPGYCPDCLADTMVAVPIPNGTAARPSGSKDGRQNR